MTRVWCSMAVALVSLTALTGCGGDNPFDAAANSTVSASTGVGDDASGENGVEDNPFLPEGNLSDCVGVLERPDCGSEEKGTRGTYMVFAVLIGGLAFIFWKIARGVKARDAVVNAQPPAGDE